MVPSKALVAALALIAACSGQTATSILPSNAPVVDLVAPPPGVADRGDDPAVVAITAAGSPPCAGALVAPDVVLTAWHCVSVVAGPSACPMPEAGPAPPLRPPGSLRVLVGDDLSTAVERARGRGIVVPDGSSMCGADIALLLLDVPIDEVQPLVVRPTGAAQGDHLRTVGWRLPISEMSGGHAPKILRDHLLVVSASPTELELAEGLGLEQSGGPALDAATAEVLGFFSRSDADPSRAVYTRADAFAALIAGALAESESPAPSARALKPKKGPADVGANCAQGSDCAAGVCVTVSGGPAGLEQYCSQTCGAHDRCPDDFRCQRGQSEPGGPQDAAQSSGQDSTQDSMQNVISVCTET
jgi:Trypsin